MRWASVIAMLLWIQAPLADFGYGEPIESKAIAEPCWIQFKENAKPASSSWAPQIRRQTALYIIRHVQRACRIIETVTAAGDERLAPQIASILNDLRDEVLEPIYRSHPDIARGSLEDEGPSTGVHPSARATPTDIGRRTAVHLEFTLGKIGQEVFRVASERTNQTGGKGDAEAAFQPFIDAVAELNFASSVAFQAYPDLWAMQLRSVPSQPRTAESDAGFRKAAPPLGSVKLSAAALAEVKAFMHQVQQEAPGDEWIGSIEWVIDQKWKGPNDADWVHGGAGLVFGTFRRTEVPPDVIDRVGGVDIVFGAPDASIFVGKTVDLQTGSFVIRD